MYRCAYWIPRSGDGASQQRSLPADELVWSPRWRHIGDSGHLGYTRLDITTIIQLVVLTADVFNFFSLFPVVSYGNQQLLNFRIGTLRVLLSQISTSDTRQDRQSSPFTASSSQRVRGMRNCRASIVAETENPFLMEHQRLYCCLLLRFKKNMLDCLVRSSSDSRSSPRGDESNSPQHSEDSPRAHT